MIRIYGIKIEDLPARDALEACLDERLVLPWRERHGALRREEHARASLGGLWLLQRAGIAGGIVYASNGRPCAVDAGVDFNITHTSRWVFCAVERFEDPLDRAPCVGLDAEELGRFDGDRSLALVERWCTPGEREFYQDAPTDERFTSLWTRKEAYVKYSGEGLCGIRQTDVTAQDQVRFAGYRIEDTVISLCCHGDAVLPETIEFVSYA